MVEPNTEMFFTRRRQGGPKIESSLIRLSIDHTSSSNFAFPPAFLNLNAYKDSCLDLLNFLIPKKPSAGIKSSVQKKVPENGQQDAAN